MKNRPVLILSSCLAGNHVRYDGKAKPFCCADSLERYFRVAVVCPECAAGMGIPREPFHIDGTGRAVTNHTGQDLTGQLMSAIDRILAELGDDPPAAAVLKSRSPSCDPGYGLFARRLRDAFPGIKIYTEETPGVENIPGFKLLQQQ